MGLRGLPADYDHNKEEDANETAALNDHFYEDRPKTKSVKEIALDYISKLNDDQKKAFEIISNSIKECTGQKRFFLEGGGGCG